MQKPSRFNLDVESLSQVRFHPSFSALICSYSAFISPCLAFPSLKFHHFLCFYLSLACSCVYNLSTICPFFSPFQTVSELRKNISSHVKMNPFEIELIYAGRSLKDDLKMEQYGLKPGCTVHVLVKKYREPSMLAEPSHSGGIGQIVFARASGK